MNDLTWNYPDEKWADWKQRVRDRMKDDPHAEPLAEAIATGWTEELRMTGGRDSGLYCWIHTTYDGIIHIGWARTFCGVEIQWENSRRGLATESTCPDCIADFSLMRLDLDAWHKQNHQRANPHCDCEFHGCNERSR